MKEINLLPPLKQKHVINLYFFLFARFIFVLLLAVTFLIGLALSGASLLLNESIQQISLHTETIDKEFNKVNQEIQKVNSQLKNIEYVLNEKKQWSSFIIPILKEVHKPVITLSGITTNKEGTMFIIQGKSQNREVLLTLQSKLKNIDFVDEVNLPLENLIRQDHIEFQMTIKLKP